MAVLAAAQLLDELMGRNRNTAPNEKVKEINWEDSEYCPFFLVKFCPHDLFVNTRADLGACAKVHDEEAKKLFQEASSRSHQKLGYMEDFLRFCIGMMNDVERKIGKGKQRLALIGKHDLPSLSPAQTQKNEEQIKILNERINGLEVEAEEAGTDGNVEQAQGLMKLCDKLKEERDILRKQIENGQWNATAELAAAQEKQMEVCEVCGAFLIVGDAQQRIDDHLMGKQHMGFARLKAAVVEIENVVDNIKEERLKRDRERSERNGPTLVDDRVNREREREREREKRRERERERDMRRSEHSVRDRERGKSRDQDHYRKDHHRERDHRDNRERDREYRHSSRSDRDLGRRHYRSSSSSSSYHR